MPTQMPGRRRTVALVALCLFSLTAGLAWAGGEDDPAYNGTGTAWFPFPDGVDMTSPPVIDQAADGTVVTAAGARPAPSGARLFMQTVVRVVRTSAAGATLSDATHMTAPFGTEPGRMFDVEALPGGRVIVAHAGVVQLTRAVQPEDAAVLVTLDIPTDGTEADVDTHAAPDDCLAEPSDDDRREAPPERPAPTPAAAEIGDDGTLYAVWNGCDGGEPMLASYFPDGEEKDAAWTGVEGTARELVLGPDGDLFVLYEGDFAEETDAGSRANFDEGGTLVTRHDRDSLDRDEAYGNEGAPGGILPGTPVDLTVDPSGRAVVWSFLNAYRGTGTTWRLYRLDAAGDLDPGWGNNGTAALQHPLFGDCRCSSSHLIAQADGRVVITGHTSSPGRGVRPPDYVIARTTASGALDPEWDGDGVRPFDVDGTPDASWISVIGEPGLQRDGKLLVATSGQTETQRPERRVPAPPDRDEASIGITRIGVTPAAAQQQQQQQQQSAPAPAPKPPTTAASQAARTCKSRRSLTIRLRTGRTKKEQSAIRTAVVRVAGKRVKVSAGARRTSRVVLTNLPKGRYTVDIRLTLADGGTVKDVRRYRTCAPKVERELAPLRTHPPKGRGR